MECFRSFDDRRYAKRMAEEKVTRLFTHAAASVILWESIASNGHFSDDLPMVWLQFTDKTAFQVMYHVQNVPLLSCRAEIPSPAKKSDTILEVPLMVSFWIQTELIMQMQLKMDSFMKILMIFPIYSCFFHCIQLFAQRFTRIDRSQPELCMIDLKSAHLFRGLTLFGLKLPISLSPVWDH